MFGSGWSLPVLPFLILLKNFLSNSNMPAIKGTFELKLISYKFPSNECLSSSSKFIFMCPYFLYIKIWRILFNIFMHTNPDRTVISINFFYVLDLDYY